MPSENEMKSQNWQSKPQKPSKRYARYKASQLQKVDDWANKHNILEFRSKSASTVAGSLGINRYDYACAVSERDGNFYYLFIPISLKDSIALELPLIHRPASDKAIRAYKYKQRREPLTDNNSSHKDYINHILQEIV